MALANYTAAEQQFITLFASVLNKAPTPDLIAEAKAYLAGGASQGAILDVLFNHPAVPYAGLKDGASTAAFLNTLIENLTAGTTGITGATKAAWVTALTSDYTAYVTNGGYTHGEFAAALVQVLQDATFPAGSDLSKLQANIDAKAEAAGGAYQPGDTFTNWGDLKDPSDVGPVEGDTIFLTAFNNATGGPDNLVGTAGNDKFIAYIFDNQNTLQSGDMLDGGAGYDTLEADIGNSQNFAITPHLTSVEKVVLRAQASRADSGDNNIANPVDVVDVPSLIEAVQGSLLNGLVGGETGVDVRGSQIDAERSVGVLHWESRNSRSDLVIEDVRILDSQITKDITIAFVQSDPGNVDFAVYFDQHSLRKAGSTVDTSLTLSISNQLELAKGYDASKPLDNVPYDRLTFKLNGVEKTIELDLTGVDTKDQLEVAIRAAFADAAAADPSLANISITRVVDGEKYLAKDGDPRTADQYVLTVPTGEKLETAATGWNASAGLPSNNAFAALIEAGSVAQSSLVTSTVILDDVGRGSMGGDLLIGGLSVGDTSNSRGVEQFDITVERSSKLQTIASTNNTLEVVNLVNGATKGDLTVTGSVGSFGYGVDLIDTLLGGGGLSNLNDLIFAPFNGPLGSTLNLPVNGYFYSNGAANTDRYITSGPNTGQYVAFAEDGKGKYVALGANDTSLPGSEHANTGFGFTDVRVINASEFEGRTNLSAELTYQVAEKYLNNKDGAPDQPGADAVEFQYDLGKAGDIFQLELSAFNLAVAGTGVFNDFILNIDGGAGNDSISVHIGNAYPQENSPLTGVAWYENAKLNANLSIDAGTGDDVVRTVGSGDWIVDLGEGNDTYYADNTGVAAAWVFNSFGQENGFFGTQNILNLQSGENDTHALFKTTVHVQFKGNNYSEGYESIAVEIPSTGYKTNDQQINQAIKTAINTDPVLSKLLEAVDGPGHTLVVRSLIDGERLDADDLSVWLTGPTTLTASEAAGYAAANGTTAANAVSAINAAVTAWGAGTDYAPAFGTYLLGGGGGTDSHNVADNVVTGGLGNDVLVLGTGAFSNDTVKYVGFGNGTDTIVNFDASWAPITTTEVPAPAVAEVVTLNFSDVANAAAGQTIIFDGTTVTLSAPATQGVIPAEDVAYQFAQQFAANANWITTHNVNTGEVTLTRVTAGDFSPNVAAADFTGTYKTAGNGVVTPTTVTEGVTGGVLGTPSNFAVNFDVPGTAADAAGSFTFDGQTVAYAEGDGAVTLAYKLAAASFPNWDTTVSVVGNTATVSFVAKANGPTPIGLAADFDLGTNVIVGTVAGAAGTANTGTINTVVTGGGISEGLDYLDFSSYANTDTVVVDGALIVGTATASIAVGSSWVQLTEHATEVGVYDIELYTQQASGPATAQLIGVADFGEHKDFIADNFIV